MFHARVIRALYPHPIPARCLRLAERGSVSVVSLLLSA